LQTGTLNKLEFFKKNKDDLLNERKLRGLFSKTVVDNLFEDIRRYKNEIRRKVLQINDGESFIVIYGEKNYPYLLSQIKDAPFMLYAKGRQELLEKENMLAVVGARKADAYGREACKNIVSEISKSGIVIVSGLAMGIDNQAHKAALEKKGDTIGIIPVEDHTPIRTGNTKRELYDKGLVLSEYPFFVNIKPWMYVSRNRIISGLSKGVFVVRAAVRSGSLSTAAFAINYNRDVFALPGNIYEVLSKGTAKLIRDGAVPVISSDDILSFYHLPDKSGKDDERIRIYSLKEEERKIIGILTEGAMHIDEIAISTGLGIKRSKTLIGSLELKGYVSRISGENYSLVR